MKKRFLVVFILFVLSLSSFGCIKIYTQKPDENRSEEEKTEFAINFYPAESLLVKAADINANPVNYDQRFLSVKGTVTATGKQPSLQISWYNIADETGTIAILTTANEIPTVGEELWVSGTVMNMTKIVGQRSLSIFLQEKNKINLRD